MASSSPSGYAVVGAWVLALLALVAVLLAVAAGLPILLIKLGWPLVILVFVLMRRRIEEVCKPVYERSAGAAVP